MSIRVAGLSLAKQRFQDYEWLVIDGASLDRTLIIVESLKIARTRIYSEPDNGIYDAMNKAIDLARGDVIYFLNADDELYDFDVLTEISDQFATCSDIEFLFGNIVVRKSGQEILKRQHFINRLTLPFESLCHQAVFATQALFMRIGRFDLRWPTSADYDWMLRVFASEAQIKYIDRYIAFFSAGGEHVRDPKALAEERRALRLQYMSSRSLAIGSWFSRAAHKSTKLLRGGYGIGESPKT